MRDVKRQFEEKVGEIDKYFELLEDIMIKDAQLIFPDDTKKVVDTDLNKILRANAFLLLYNLIESSIAQAIEAIHIEMINTSSNYNQIKKNIQNEIIKHIKKNINPLDLTSRVHDIAVDIIEFYPQKDKIFSGNVDAREIKKVSEKYGFSCTTNARKTRNGANLVVVKEKRNHLAHGYISFQECGKDVPIETVIEIKNEVIEYIRQILENIEIFLRNREYAI